MARRKNVKPAPQAGRQEQDEGTRIAPWAAWAAPLVLAAGLFGLYLAGLHPGADSGDAAELQYACPLLGICHPPGYQIEVTIGWLFGLLPLASSIAWRINLLMAICGTVGCLCLYGAVRRITGRIVPGIVAAAVLGLSTIYWSHCLIAEAYVFYAAFLLAGVYTMVRFVQSDRARWLCLTAVLVGASVADRPSELFVLPAFLAAWIAFRKQGRLSWARLGVTAALVAMPFAFSVGCFLVRNDSRRLAIRDDAIRDAIIVDTSAEISRRSHEDLSAGQKLTNAVTYCLGITWTKAAAFKADRVGKTFKKYAWLLSGLGAWGERFRIKDCRDPGAERGTSIGLLGVLLAAAGTVIWRRRLGWLLLGWGLALGNLAFILWYWTWDSLTFTIPGLAGWALLAGLGAAGTTDSSAGGRRWLAYRIACLAAPLFLLVSNHGFVDRSGRADRQAVEFRRRVAEANWPTDSVILTSYWPATSLRYGFYCHAGRDDVYVICAASENVNKLIEHFTKAGRPVFLPAARIPPRLAQALWRYTPRDLSELGYLQVNPPAPARRP